MALSIHKNIKVYDVNKFVNRLHVRQLCIADEPPILRFRRTAQHTFELLHEDIAANNARHINGNNSVFIQRSLEIYSEVAQAPANCQIEMRFERIMPGHQDWSFSSGPTGILCIDRDGLEQFKFDPKLRYSEVDYELTQGFLVLYTNMYHKQINIQDQKHQISFTIIPN